jgi:hypothetical protein
MCINVKECVTASGIRISCGQLKFLPVEDHHGPCFATEKAVMVEPTGPMVAPRTKRVSTGGIP